MPRKRLRPERPLNALERILEGEKFIGPPEPEALRRRREDEQVWSEMLQVDPSVIHPKTPIPLASKNEEMEMLLEDFFRSLDRDTLLRLMMSMPAKESQRF